MAKGTSVDASLKLGESRDDLIRDIFRGYLNYDTGHRELRLITIGEAGQGKSALVNGLLGEEVAEEGSSLKGVTKKVAKHTNSDGISVVWDTPAGFGMDDVEKDKQKVEQMASECAGKVDLMLYCIRMDHDRWPKNSDVVTIRMMTETFGPKIWQYCQFVLTFANRVVVNSQEEDVEDPGQYFSDKVWVFEEQVRKALKEHGHLSEEDIQEIHVVPVGDPRPRRKNKSWKLPTIEDWFVDLWLAVSQRIQQSALPTLLQLNRHRLDLDEDSLNPAPAEEAETHSRPLTYHAVHIDEHTELPDRSLDCSESIPMTSPAADPVEEQVPNDRPQRHSIPLYRIIYEQLKDDDSAFKRYVKFYWEQQGQKNKVFGHIRGLMDGIKNWIKSKHGPAINWKEEEDTDITSSI